MKRFLTTLMLIGLLAPGPVIAQQTLDPALLRSDCDCGDIEIVVLLDREIASIEQKMIRLGRGQIEDESGLPNNLIVLMAMRDEARVMREGFVRDITRCRRTCRQHPDADSIDPRSALTGASAACPLCGEAARRLATAEAAVAAALSEMEDFRRHNRVRERGGVNSSDFDERVEAYQDARARLQATLVRHAELIEAIEVAEARADPLNILEEWEGEDGRLNVFEFFGGMAHGYTAAAGGLFDYIIQTGRNDGLPIPDEAYISRLGEIWAAERYARQYYRDVVEPAKRALETAQYRLPNMEYYRGADADEFPGSGGRGPVLEELARYERRLRPLIEERDSRHAALIGCNVRMCRPQPDVSDLWGEDGLYTPSSLEDRFPDLPPDPADEPDNGEGLLTGDEFEGPDLSGAGEFSGGADGTGLPDDPVFADVPAIPSAPELPPEVVAALAAAQAQQASMSGPCDIQPDRVCRHLNNGEQTDCETRITDLRDRCVAFQRDAFVTMGRVETCRASCDYSRDSINTQFWLRDGVLATIDANRDHIAAERRRTEGRLAEVTAEIDRLEQAQRENVIHIYRNPDTDELVQHAGTYFDPEPPLIYAGTMTPPASAEDRATLAGLQAQRHFLETALDTQSTTDSLNQWSRTARMSWTGGQDGDAVWPDMMACTPRQVDGQHDACLASCDAAGETLASVQSICQPAGVVGRLNLPTTTRQLYPPDGSD